VPYGAIKIFQGKLGLQSFCAFWIQAMNLFRPEPAIVLKTKLPAGNQVTPRLAKHSLGFSGFQWGFPNCGTAVPFSISLINKGLQNWIDILLMICACHCTCTPALPRFRGSENSLAQGLVTSNPSHSALSRKNVYPIHASPRHVLAAVH